MSVERQHSHSTLAPRRRALLVGAEIHSERTPWHVEDSLRELALLADTAGLEVVGEVTQHLEKPQAKYLIGSGKVNEIGALREELNYDLIIFDNELSPGQTRNLENELQTGVLDRTALILDIFALHARTHEGRLQVELAQYEFLLPRLRRAWTHLERQAGGTGAGASSGGLVGLRGPGETQLELDRRLIMRRISWLKEQLEAVRAHRARHRDQRRQQGVPIVALVGYTNAGKSTLLNALSGADIYTANQLFATLDPTARHNTLPTGHEIVLTDTVGFIQNLPTQLIAAFRATLEEIGEAHVLLHVMDASHPNAREQAATVKATLQELGVDDTPTITVLNKLDLLPDSSPEALAELVERLGIEGDYVAVSAQQGTGLEQLKHLIEEVLARSHVSLVAMIPYSRGDLIAMWRKYGVVEREDHRDEGTLVRGHVPHAFAHQLRTFRIAEESKASAQPVAK